MSEQKSTRKTWREANETADEWTPDNVSDLTNCQIVITEEHQPYLREITFKNQANEDETKELAFLHVKIGKKILPCRCNKISVKNLSLAYKTGKIAEWANKSAVLCHQTIGDKTFLVFRAKGRVD